jgi:hypothetical protein
MVIILEKLFVVQLQMCDHNFQDQFRKFFQQLKVVDKVTEIKNVYQIGMNLYKVEIDKSKIALRISDNTVIIGCFLKNQFYVSDI